MEASNRLFRYFCLGLTAGLVPLALAGCGGDDDPEPVVSINVSGSYSVQIGQTVSLAAITINGSDTSYTWSSADESIATVDDSGVVTGVAAGEVEITVVGADTSATGTHPIVVLPETGGGGDPVVTVSGVYAIELGGEATLMAETTNGTDASYTWTTNNDQVLTVDENGLVTGVAVGTAVITATGDDTGASGSFGLTVTIDVPVFERWAGSGHADRSAEAFRHWDEDDPAEVPTACARCHSSEGYGDYLGADGSAAGTVDSPAPLPNGVSCVACHTDEAVALDSVTFPSGVTIDGIGSEARCMTCHQGRGSTDDVNDAIMTAGVGEDEVSGDLSFINIHYYAAGATIYAGQVRGGYQYEDQVYDWRFRHVEGRDTCIGCHDPHSLEIRQESCESCHGAFTDPREIRMPTSNQDYDGDGDTAEGIAEEITTLREGKLLAAIQAYAAEEAGTAICYDNASYPYWFQDTNASGGTCDPDEASFPNAYNAWTPRLLKAAYNYQVTKKDPAGFAHNAKYIIQLVWDSTVDLNSVLTNPIDMAGTARNDFGHFNGAGEAARHWDEDAEVSASCSACHGGSEGYAFFLEYGVGTTVEEQANGLDCATCHANVGNPDFALRVAEDVTFPSGAVVDLQGAMTDMSSNLCGQCHAGRNSGLAVDNQIASAGVPDNDTVSSSLRFQNVHYKPAAGTLVGAQSMVGYEYMGRTYAGTWNHLGGNACVACHDPVMNNHSFLPSDTFDMGGCGPCHNNVQEVGDIRGMSRNADYDGDGDTTEPLADEIGVFEDGDVIADCAASPMPAECGLSDVLLLQLQAAATASGTSICYNAHRYPYWFEDTNSNGVCDPDEGSGYRSFTGRTLKAAYNYQYSQKDLGAWAHNFDYMTQLMIDTIEDLGGNVAGYTRP